MIRCPTLTLRIGRVATPAAPTDSLLTDSERVALEKTSASVTGRYPSAKGRLQQEPLDFGAKGKIPHSVLRFAETKDMNATAFHALAVPGAVDGKHFVAVYTCTAKTDSDCATALVDVVTRGPPKI